MPRKEERIAYLKEVELEFASGKRAARISDISMGGCYIDTIAQVPMGEVLTVQLSTVTGASLQFKGKVAYLLEGFGFGVEFTELTDEHRDFLAGLVKSTTG
jgi:hypothetical protein